MRQEIIELKNQIVMQHNKNLMQLIEMYKLEMASLEQENWSLKEKLKNNVVIIREVVKQ